MNYQCAELAQYAQLWLSFRDAELRAEIIEHRDTCPICAALREATIERRRGSTTTDLHYEIPIEFPAGIKPELESILRRLYRITLIRAGDIGWVGERPDTSGGERAGGIRIDYSIGAMVGEATGG
jgi:hypothetical protein